ncbi:MAG: LamG domain-containing protein [Chloroflexota bacterium]|nr:LamG domain-containing protein [Chloroflexota bacterium]
MAEGSGPVGSWDLALDGRDGTGHGIHAVARGPVRFGSARVTPLGLPAATFHGDARLEVPPSAGLRGVDLTVAAWVNAAAKPTTVLGDVVSWFDPASRHGFTLGFEHGSPSGSHGNDRMPWFGADAGTTPRLTDHGRPGGASVMVCSLAAFEGDLYAATWEGGPSPRGQVYRLRAATWEECGSPWDANAVTRLAVHDGALHAGVSRIRAGGSALADSANQNPGGRVLRYAGNGHWTDLGQIEGADSITALVPFGGDLYAAPMYSEGLFRLETPGRWTWCGSPGRRLLALGVHGGALYGAGNDHANPDSAIALTKAGVVVPARSNAGGGGVFRYDGSERWTARGLQVDTTQLYSIETYGDRIHIGTWPTGRVFRAVDLDAPGEATWESIGRLGNETEIMNLGTYNGMLYGGTLPHAQIYRYDGDDDWAVVGTLDETPDALYRRAASMVVFGGELFVGTLPSAHVHSMQTGAVATGDRSLAPGWHHLAGVRRGRSVSLYVDGAHVATRESDAMSGRLAPRPDLPLVLGGGPRAGFEGDLAAVRLWERALDPGEVRTLAL